jgi:hypothetical protein
MHPVPSPPTMAFVSSVQTRHSRVMLICSPSCRIGPTLRRAREDFYCRAFDGLVTLVSAGAKETSRPNLFIQPEMPKNRKIQVASLW